MKKVLSFITVIVCLFLFASCGKVPVNTTLPLEPAAFLIQVSGEDVFEKGYKGEKFTGTTTVNFAFKTPPADNAVWSVYIADDELSDEEAQKLKNTDPVLTGEGKLDVKYGQWIYIFCDVNSETAEEPSKTVYTYSWLADFA